MPSGRVFFLKTSFNNVTRVLPFGKYWKRLVTQLRQAGITDSKLHLVRLVVAYSNSANVFQLLYGLGSRGSVCGGLF